MELDINIPYQVKKIDKIENNLINFSIVIVTRNNDKYLKELLNSLNSYKEKDGIVTILDIQSTDNTLDISKEWGCRIENGHNFFRVIDEDMSNLINQKFKRDEENIININDVYIDYSSARDYVSSLVEHDIILMLDPNSRIINFNIDEIIKYINSGFDYLEFSKYNNINNIFGFYNKRKYKWNNLINEELSLFNNIPHTGVLPDNILSVEILDKRFEDTYLISLSVESFLNFNNYKILNSFAYELKNKGFIRSYIDIFDFLTNILESNIEKSKNYISLGDSYMDIGDEKSAINCYYKSYIEYSKWRTPLYKLAEYYFVKSDWDKSIFYSLGCLSINKPDINLNENEFYYNDGPYSILYVSYWWNGNPEKGKYYFDKALEINPNNEIYMSEVYFHYKYGGNLINGNLSFKEIQYLYDISKKYDSILEIGSEQGRSTHALITDNSNLINILNINVDTYSIIQNLNNPGNIRFVNEDDIINDKFELILINCSNISHDDLKELIQKYQFKATRKIIGYNYICNKNAVDETLEISGLYDNLWYKDISNFEKKTIYIRKNN